MLLFNERYLEFVKIINIFGLKNFGIEILKYVHRYNEKSYKIMIKARCYRTP